MKKQKLILPFVLLIAMAWTGCEKDYNYVVPKKNPNEVPAVSFKNEVYPIFSTSCLGGGCHDDGDIPPYLSTAVQAYDQMWNNDNGVVLIDTVNAENSILYVRLHSTGSNKMPPSGNLSSVKQDLILTWIKQGAKNN